MTASQSQARGNPERPMVAVLVEDGFEQIELTSPCDALREAGFDPQIISASTDKKRVKGWQHTDWGEEFDVNTDVEHANIADFVGLLLPGGVMNPDKVRRHEKAVDFARAFMTEGKPVAAICHGPWTLVEADCVRNRRMTSFNSIRTDLKNAGANWVDEEVVVDDNLITSRNPDDLDAFNRETCRAMREASTIASATR
ncbi:MAG: type 1 glutamine amidotransferase domain-containing protein [Planctomycetota bacterium]